MTEDVDLNFLARQMQRTLAELKIIRGSLELARRGIARNEDSIGSIRSDIQGLSVDIIGLRTSLGNEITSLRNEMHSGFEALDMRLRLLEDVPIGEL